MCRGDFVTEGDTRFDNYLERYRLGFLYNYIVLCLTWPLILAALTLVWGIIIVVVVEVFYCIYPAPEETKAQPEERDRGRRRDDSDQSPRRKDGGRDRHRDGVETRRDKKITSTHGEES